MKILGVIPARGGSKGVPRKNIRLLNGVPLIEYSIKAAMNSMLSSVIVSTDDDEIASVSKQAGANVPYKRSEVLANDKAKSLDVVIDALKFMEGVEGKFDAVMMLQPTTPFRTTDDINYAIKLLQDNPNADSVISVVDVKGHHPARMKYFQDGLLIDPPFVEEYENQNRQELTPMFIRNGAIYLSRRDIILNSSFKGKTCLGLVMPDSRSVNIDTMQDFDYAEWLLSRNLKV
jgi:CMP-N,N'-diacetyllegionaminic acid synthase